MSTQAKTTIFNEEGEPILSFICHADGYFEGMGVELQEFLSEVVITNGISFRHRNNKTANGMGCLAAQVLAHFKNGVGGIYACTHNDEQDYNYEIRYVHSGVDGRVSLVGTGYKETKRFKLYPDEQPQILRRVQFVYAKGGGDNSWRTVDVVEETNQHIAGIEDGKFKKFLRSKIVGGRVLPV